MAQKRDREKVPPLPGGASLTSKVEHWLNHQGYVLEFRTYDAFVRHGLSALMGFHSGSSDTPSEIDVIAQEAVPYEGINKGPYAILRVLCECKYSHSHPWVLLCTGREGFSPPDWLAVPKSEEVGALFYDAKPLAESFFGNEYFKVKMPIAHNIVLAFRGENDRDDAYKALQKLGHASWHLAEVTTDGKFRPSSVIIPCIVLEAPLFAARFSGDRIVTEPVGFGRVSWYGTGRLTLVDVVQIDFLNTYAAMMARSLKMMLPAMLSALKHRPQPRRSMAVKPEGF